jgi:hypothetical protein
LWTRNLKQEEINMGEVLNDETTVEIVEKSAVVSRTIKERFDAEEYLRRIGQLEASKENMNKQLEEINATIAKFGAQAEGLKKIREEEIAVAKAEAEKLANEASNQ